MATNLNISTNTTEVSSRDNSITITDNNTGNIVNISQQTPTVTISAAGIAGGRDFLGDNVSFQHITASGEISASGIVYGSQISIGGGIFTSASLAAAEASGDNLGNHTATQDINLGGNNIFGILNITASGNISASGTITASSITAVSGAFSYLEGNSPLTLRLVDFDSDTNLGVKNEGGDARLLTANDVPIIDPIVLGTFTAGIQASGRTQFGGAHEVELYSQGATKIYNVSGSESNVIGSYILMGSGSLPGGNNIANTDPHTIRFGFSGSKHPTLGDFYGGTDTIIFDTSKGHITASGNISASGNIVANNFIATGDNILEFQSPANPVILRAIVNGIETYQFGDSTTPNATLIAGSNINLSAPTTASIISASGTIVGSNLSGTNTGDQDLSGFATTGSNITFANVTSSGNISSSRNIIGNQITASDATITNILTVKHLKATTVSTLSITSSIVTSSIIFSSGSTKFGDEILDTHTFIGNITASGNVKLNEFLKLNVNNKFIQGKKTGGTTHNILGINDSDVVQVSNENTPIEIKGSSITLSAPITSSIISASKNIIGSTGSFSKTVITLKSGTEDSPFLIKIANSNGQDEKLQMTKDGVLRFGSLNTLPTAITGGLVYSSSAFYMGL